MGIRSLFRATTQVTYRQFISDFFSRREHEWIVSHPHVKKNIQLFFEKIPATFLEHLQDLALMASPGRFAITINTNCTHVIVLYSEVILGLKSDYPEEAYAVLAHELGHIVLNHRFRPELGHLASQLEADHFAFQLGMANELVGLLYEQNQTHEVRTRIAHLNNSIAESEDY